MPCWFKKFVRPKNMLDRIAKANPIILQKVGDKPSEPKLFPISVVIGINFFSEPIKQILSYYLYI